MKLSAALSVLVLLPNINTNAASSPHLHDGEHSDMIALLADVRDMYAKIQSLERGVANQRKEIANFKLEASADDASSYRGNHANPTNGHVHRDLGTKSGAGSSSGSNPDPTCASTVNYNFADPFDLLNTTNPFQELAEFNKSLVINGLNETFNCQPKSLDVISYIADNRVAPTCLTGCANVEYKTLSARELELGISKDFTGPGTGGFAVTLNSEFPGSIENYIDLNKPQMDIFAELVKLVALDLDVVDTKSCENSKNGKKACIKVEGCEWDRNTCSTKDTTGTSDLNSKVDGITTQLQSDGSTTTPIAKISTLGFGMAIHYFVGAFL